MEKKEFEEFIRNFLKNSELNSVTADVALSEDCIGKVFFTEPLFGYGSADDEMFEEMKSVIGKHFRAPSDWLKNAKTVISVFTPFTNEIIKSNAVDIFYPSRLWLHGRFEGQLCLNEMAKKSVEFFERHGYSAVSPCQTDDFFSVRNIEREYDGERLSFTSNWSERHVAFITGVGTFGLSKALITEKGKAGRLTSILTSAEFEPTKRNYTEVYEHCNMCGACASRCPVDAISLEKGKEHMPCCLFLDEVLAKEKYTRYACGKCQTKVPCSQQIPKKRASL